MWVRGLLNVAPAVTQSGTKLTADSRAVARLSVGGSVGSLESLCRPPVNPDGHEWDALRPGSALPSGDVSPP